MGLFVIVVYKIKTVRFAKLTARVTKRARKSISLAWKQAEGADGYLIYGNQCGKPKSCSRTSRATA